jgi:hypothetical protein
MADTPEVNDQLTNASPAGTSDPENHDDSGNSVTENSTTQPDQNDSVGSAAQSRIRKLSATVKQAAQEASYWRDVARRYAEADRNAIASGTTAPANRAPQNAPGYQTEEVQRAFSTLKAEGMATQDDLKEALLRVQWDRQHDRNENDINKRGSNMPHYDREEVEQYARSRSIPDPMVAYRELYFDEIVDAARRGDVKPQGSRITTQKPTKAPDVSREPMSVESFRSKLAGPEGKAFYDKLMQNPAEFDRLMRTWNDE